MNPPHHGLQKQWVESQFCDSRPTALQSDVGRESLQESIEKTPRRDQPPRRNDFDAWKLNLRKAP